MKQFIVTNQRSVAGLAACLLIGVLTLSFQDSPFVHSMIEKSTPLEDTTKPFKKKNSMTMKEFDRLSENLDKEIAEQIGRIDLQKIEAEVQAAMKEVDVEKIMKEVEESLKEVNMEKILADIKVNLENIRLDELSDVTETALAETRKELEKSMAEIRKIDKDAIRKELENSREEIEKSRSELKNIDMNKIISEAKEGIEKAKYELKQLKQMFNEMEQDGLIDAKKGFRLEYKDKDLFIDGKKQPASVTDKYRKYFKDDHFEITIDRE